MAFYKVSMLIQLATGNNRVGGWSESLYLDKPDSGAALVAIKTLAVLRAATLPASARIIGTRATLPSNPGLSQAVPQALPGVVGNPNDVPQMALLVKLFTNEGTQRSLILRGIPDDFVKLGDYTPDTAYTAAMNAFLTGLTGYAVRSRDRANPTLPLMSVTAGGLVTTTADHALVVGNSVKFYRTNDSQGRAIKDTFRVSAVTDARTFTVVPWGGVPVLRGAVRKLSAPAFYTILNDSRPQRAVVRKVGKPFFQYVGRS